MKEQPIKVALLGWPVGHSISPAMHNAVFRALNLSGRYEPLAVPPGQLAAAVRDLAGQGYRGANVTIPHKQAVMHSLDEISPAAAAIGAVNTIVVGPHGHLHGDNTDWLGFLAPLDRRGLELAGRRALILGAGGSARAVAHALAWRNIAHLSIWNRTASRAEALADDLIGLGLALPLSLVASADLHSLTRDPIDLVVNTTPLGMWPQIDRSPWPIDLALPATALVYDLVYRPQLTQLLRRAQQAGCLIQDGLEMLVMQGAAAFEQWTGHTAPVAVMMRAAKEALAGQGD